MRSAFAVSTLQQLQADGWVATSDTLLAVCASDSESEVFERLGFYAVTLSNLNKGLTSRESGPHIWSYQDVQNLSYPDSSFDHVFVSDGLHHCESPHRGLLEMFRVARRSVIVFESRDSLLMRLATRLGLVLEYELSAVISNDFSHGGVNDSEVPNFVYRWSEREFEKTIASFHPMGPCRFRYFYSMNLPAERLSHNTNRLKSLALRLAVPIASLLGSLAPKQSNSFCMVAQKPEDGRLWPWLEMHEGGLRFRQSYANSPPPETKSR